MLILGPPLLGVCLQFLINPVLGRWSTWSELITLQDRLVGEMTNRSKTPVVLVNLPSEKEKSPGLMTSVFPATDQHTEMAAVYFSIAPRSNRGVIRIIPTSEITQTRWTVKEFQMFQFTVGSVSPPRLFDEIPTE